MKRRRVVAVTIACLAAGCAPLGDDPPKSKVVLVNDYPPAQAGALVVYDAFWQAVSFQGNPLSPGNSRISGHRRDGVFRET